jgi:DNA-directed RNA polymerase specialized sigma24 family protein
MTKISEKILPHLPYLRRHARSLLGSQKGGDAHVRAILEALIADPDLFDHTLEPKIALYRLFHSVWNRLEGIEKPLTRTHLEDVFSVDQELANLSPLHRQAYLLIAVEQFSFQDVSTIMQLKEETIKHYVKQAQDNLKSLAQTKVLIIEDEPMISMDLAMLMEDMGHQVAGQARTHKEAVAKAKEVSPGLVLADIQLADGSSGIDAVKDILESISVPVIFITSFPERLLSGERPEPTFLITKPYDPDMVKAVVSQALLTRQTAEA